MKHSILTPAGLALVIFMASCGSNAPSDSAKEAEKMNDAKIDSAKKADTISTVNSAMADRKPDADFAVAAADGGKLEVELGKLAEQKGVSRDIKRLGAMMVKDHSALNAELKSTAAKKSITLPETLSNKCQRKLDELKEKTGTDFDKAYADLMVSDHKEDIDDFKKEAEKGNDPQLSTWAKSKVPTLEHHLMMAEQAKKHVNKD